MRTINNIQNIPLRTDFDIAPYVVYTTEFVENNVVNWFYGAYTNRDRANEIAMKIGGSVCTFS